MPMHPRNRAFMYRHTWCQRCLCSSPLHTRTHAPCALVHAGRHIHSNVHASTHKLMHLCMHARMHACTHARIVRTSGAPRHTYSHAPMHSTPWHRRVSHGTARHNIARAQCHNDDGINPSAQIRAEFERNGGKCSCCRNLLRARPYACTHTQAHAHANECACMCTHMCTCTHARRKVPSPPRTRRR